MRGRFLGLQQSMALLDPSEAPVQSSLAVLAQVDVNPTSSGMPGADLIQQLLDWLQMLALWGSLAALLLGAAVYGGSRESGSYSGANKGKALAMGGVVGAIIAGLAPGAVNLLFQAAS
jgi:hypothetical protein